MSYTILSTEKTRKSCAESETKALLYLMNFRSDSEEIHYFVVDFFNDISGVDRLSSKVWDVQSKGAKNNSPLEIGKELVTLFKNFLSELPVCSFILFLGGVSSKFRKDKNKTEFDITNIEKDALDEVVNGLKSEANKKEYIVDKSQITDVNINNFLSRVTFVIDNKTKSESIKAIIKINPLILPKDSVLEAIFDHIRDKQSAKKNNAVVDGITINATEDFVYYSRHLTSPEIKMMVLNEILNNNLMGSGITPSFIPVYNKFKESEQKNMVEDCKLEIATTLFDVNNAEGFWEFFIHIYSLIMSNKDKNIDEIYLCADKAILMKVRFLTHLSIKFFMAKIKDGMIYED